MISHNHFLNEADADAVDCIDFSTLALVVNDWYASNLHFCLSSQYPNNKVKQKILSLRKIGIGV